MCLFFHDYVFIDEVSQVHYWVVTKSTTGYIYSTGKAICSKCWKEKQRHTMTLNYCPYESLYKESKHVYINKID